MSRMRRVDWAISLLWVSIALALWHKVRPPQVDAVLPLVYTLNGEPIRDLDQPRRPLRQFTVWVDVLDLHRDGRLQHPRLGDLGRGEQVYIDLDVTIEVEQTASYRFEVGSDDGFALAIDGQRLCAYTGDRAFTPQTCTTLLLQGQHRLQLSYFQAGGPAGLQVRFARAEETQWHWLGSSAAGLRILPGADR